MAENKERGAQHLTSLDIDISGIAQSLEEAKRQIEQFSLETGRTLKNNMSAAFDFSDMQGSRVVGTQMTFATDIAKASTKDIEKAQEMIENALYKYKEKIKDAQKEFESLLYLDADSLSQVALSSKASDIKRIFGTMLVPEGTLKNLGIDDRRKYSPYVSFQEYRNEEEKRNLAWQYRVKSPDVLIKDLIGDPGLGVPDDEFAIAFKQSLQRILGDELPITVEDSEIAQVVKDFVDRIKQRQSDLNTNLEKYLKESLGEAQTDFKKELVDIEAEVGSGTMTSALQKYKNDFIELGIPIKETSEELENFTDKVDKAKKKSKELEKDKTKVYVDSLTGGKIDNIIFGESLTSATAEEQFVAVKKRVEDVGASVDRVTVKTNETNKEIEGTIEYTTELGDKYRETYKQIKIREDAEKEYYAFIRTNSQAVYTEEERIQRLRAKGINDIDIEILKREREGKAFSSQLKERMKLQQQEFKSTQQTSKQLTSLADKYDTLAARAKRAGREGIASQAQETSKSIRNLVDSLEKGDISAADAKEELKKLGRELVELKNQYVETGAASESFLKKFKDKAGWLASYYVINQLGVVFKDVIQIIKQTEDAVVELQRVLNEDVSQSDMSDELYEIAYQYGRTFDEVSEVATKFAQSGKTWNETLELTRGTMLALNTAELDVTQSTQGLIAILAQWNLEAEDFQGVIDKINTTADSFAVTSETIVAALQRASSSAKNANISLEETIGIITAMAEATGRSGENIGTALNSLIIYTSKAQSLEVFAGLSDQMDELVKKYRAGTASIFEVWQGLSGEISSLSAEQQKTILQMTDYEQFADELESQASEYTDKIKETYQTAGSYRQNYFIALLQDMAKAQAAIDNMANAQGYSAQENEKYMESLTANFNQLKAALAELAVQMGDGEFGLLNTMKGLVNIATGLVKLQKSLGGIYPLLLGIGSALMIINAQKMATKVSNFTDGLKTTISALIATRNGLIGIKAANDSVVASNVTLQASFGWIGLLGLAISALVSAYYGVNEAVEETNRLAQEAASKNIDEADSIQALKQEYAEIVEMQDGTKEKEKALVEFKEKLIKSYHQEKEAIEQLNGARADEIDFLDEEYKKKIRAAYVEIKDQYDKAVEVMEQQKSDFSIYSPNLDTESFEILKDVLGEYKQIGTSTFFDFGTTSLEKQVTILEEILATNGLNKQTESELNRLLEERKELLEKYGSVYKEYSDTIAQNYLLQEDMQEKILQASKEENLEERTRLYNEIVERIKENVAGEEAQAAAIAIVGQQLGIVEEKADDAGNALDHAFGSDITTQIEALAKSIEGLNSEIDNFQSGYDTLISAIQEFNENGYLSVDTIQALISAGGEYISLLEYTAQGIGLNKQRTDELLASQSNNINALLQQAATADILRIAQKYLGEEISDTAQKEDGASQSTSNLSANVQTLASQLVAGTITLNEFNNELARMANQAGRVIDTRGLSQEIAASLESYKGLASAIGNLAVNNAAWSKSAASAANNAAKAQTDALKKELEAQKKAVKERYDAEIQALKDVQSENDRLAQQEEYYRKRRDYLNDIEKAATRSGVEYREQEAEARRNLEDLDREWQETVEKWSIEDQIKELEALRDAEIAAIDAQIEKLTATTGAAMTGIVNSSSQANSVMLENYEKEYLEPLMKETENAFDDVTKNVVHYMAEAHKHGVSVAELSAKNMAKAYSTYFFEPMNSKFSVFHENMTRATTSLIEPLSLMTPFNKNPLTASTVIQNSNTSNNSNVYANFFNKNNYLQGVKSLWIKP